MYKYTVATNLFDLMHHADFQLTESFLFKYGTTTLNLASIHKTGIKKGMCEYV